MYVTPQDIRDYMKQSPGRVTDEDLDVHIETAVAYIHGRLGSFYVTPFPMPTPDIIVTIARDLAIFFTFEALYSSNAPNMDEYQKVRYDRAMDLLDRIVSGEMTLPGRQPLPEGKSRQASTTDGVQNIFNYDDDYGWDPYGRR